MSGKKKGLGRGLSALFGDEKPENNSEKKSEELVEENKEQLEKKIVDEDKEVE